MIQRSNLLNVRLTFSGHTTADKAAVQLNIREMTLSEDLKLLLMN